MLQLFCAEESLGWLLLYAHSAGPAHTWDDRHISSSHPNPPLGNLWCACVETSTPVTGPWRHYFILIAYLYGNVTDFFHLVKACSTINI